MGIKYNSNALRLAAAIGILGISLPVVAQAQGAEAALAEARARVACGTGTPVSAVYLPNGAIEVTCRQNVTQQATANTAAAEAARQNPLGGTALTTGPTAGAIATAVVLGIALNDSGESTTTTAPSEPEIVPE